MRKYFLKTSALVLTGSLLLSMTACSGSKENGSKDGNASAANSGPAVELKVEVFDRGTQGQAPVDNNYWTNWIQENFGKPNNINVKFIPVPRAQDVDKLNLMMAANEAPDIVLTYDTSVVNNYATQGGITDLKDNIDKYGPNLKKFLGDDVLKAGVFSGKQYTIPAKRALVGIQLSLIRKDWLDKLGLKAPTTTEQFYSTLKAFKEKDPGGLGGAVIPYGATIGSAGSAYEALPNTSFNALIDSFRTKMTEEEFYTLPSFVQPGIKDGFKFMNKIFNEGLMSPEFALDKDGKKKEADVANGKVGIWDGNLNGSLLPSPGTASALLKNVPGAAIDAIDSYTDYEGKHPQLTYPSTGVYIMVPKASKRANEAIKYLDWMSKQDVLFTLQNGMEGIHYNLKDGMPVAINVQGDNKLGFSSNIDYTIITNGMQYGSLDKNIKYQASVNVGFEDLYTKAYKYSIQDGYTAPRFDKPIASDLKYNKTLAQKALEITVKSITCKPSEFDKTYDSLVQEYMQNGGQEIVNEKKAAYQAMKK